MKIAQVEGSALREAFRKAGFSVEELDKVLPSIESFPARYLKAGETLLREGDLPGNACFIQRGRLAIWKRRPSRLMGRFRVARAGGRRRSGP